MKIAAGSDRRGYSVKQELLSILRTLGAQTEDFGCDSVQGVDYPDIAYPLAMAVAARQCDLGILIDGDGMGMSMVANKVHGVRAITVHDEFSARCAREKYHCNIIGIGADWIGGHDLRQIIEMFLQTIPGAGRHAGQIERLREIEELLAPVRSGKQNHRLPEHLDLQIDRCEPIAARTNFTSESITS